MSIQRIDDRIRERSLLTHEFYQQWSAGTLSHDALAGYAREYFALVRAVPEMMQPMIAAAPPALRADLEEQRAEEASHIPLWTDFAAAFGIEAEELERHEPLPETREAIDTLRGLTSEFERGACAMYALELEIPAMAFSDAHPASKFFFQFAFLAVSQFDRGTEVVGLLFSAPAVGASPSACATGPPSHSPSRCSAWPWKTSVAATTRRRWNCTRRRKR